MTRTAFQPAGDAESDVASVNLTHLLARLEQNILSSSADLKLLRQSRYHRARVGANIDYAHSLLVQIERSLPKIKSPERRHERQTDLAKKRTALKLVKERLDLITEEVEGIAPAGEEGVLFEDDDEEEDGEDLLIDTPSRSSTSEVARETIDVEEEESLRRAETVTVTEAETETEAPGPQSTTTMTTSTSTLRHRHPQTSTLTTSTSTSTTTALPTTTLPPPSTSPVPPSQSKTQITESTLSAHRLEQESLTESLVTLASQLKASSQAFQSSLEAEKSILARAVEGLDRNVSGLEAAGKRMGVLRRMTEGRGWWGRMMMYAWIFALWLVALAIVFLGPKVRF
ncbi:hypothetical protein VTN77DRAFT_8864 [Rasamsonia byssochlamydoides]|uniref:uncharacterized protein n=1 Tax=Rasamsonia byssochlamydoides TaxID=89139 RepID=UPI003743D0D7